MGTYDGVSGVSFMDDKLEAEWKLFGVLGTEATGQMER